MTDDRVAVVLDQARRICEVAAPPFGEGARAEFVARLFDDAGVPARIDAIGNVIAWLGSAEEPPAVLAAHLDTVFEAGTPIVVQRRDGRMSGPGLGDNSLGVAALLHLAREFRDRPVAHPLALVATVGEEGLGDLRGAKALLDELPCRAFVAVEGQALSTITVAAVGSMRFRVRIDGPGGHPWGDRDRPSAAHALVQRLSAVLRELPSDDLVLNVGVIAGGSAINVIASEAVAELDLRSEDERSLQGAARRLAALIEIEDAVLRTSLEVVGHRPGGKIDAHHPLLQAARDARRAVGLAPAREDASSTDANAALGRGIPAVTVGVSTGGNAHRLDDYIDLDPLPAGLASLAELARRLAAGL